MRPNTMESGIFSTSRSRPVSTSMLTRMLVPKPKKAFHSPETHSAGFLAIAALMMFLPSSGFSSAAGERGKHRIRGRPPAEDAALGLDHRQPRFVKFRNVRGAAIGEHDAAVAAVVRLPHAGVDADLGGHAANEQILDPVPGQEGIQMGLVEGALARLVDDRLAGNPRELGHDGVSPLAVRASSSAIGAGPASMSTLTSRLIACPTVLTIFCARLTGRGPDRNGWGARRMPADVASTRLPTGSDLQAISSC